MRAPLTVDGVVSRTDSMLEVLIAYAISTGEHGFYLLYGLSALLLGALVPTAGAVATSRLILVSYRCSQQVITAIPQWRKTYVAHVLVRDLRSVVHILNVAFVSPLPKSYLYLAIYIPNPELSMTVDRMAEQLHLCRALVHPDQA